MTRLSDRLDYLFCYQGIIISAFILLLGHCYHRVHLAIRTLLSVRSSYYQSVHLVLKALFSSSSSCYQGTFICALILLSTHCYRCVHLVIRVLVSYRFLSVGSFSYKSIVLSSFIGNAFIPFSRNIYFIFFISAFIFF